MNYNKNGQQIQRTWHEAKKKGAEKDKSRVDLYSIKLRNWMRTPMPKGIEEGKRSKANFGAEGKKLDLN